MPPRMYHGRRTAAESRRPHKSARKDGLYKADNVTSIRKADENPLVMSLYDTLLKGKEHELLHNDSY